MQEVQWHAKILFLSRNSPLNISESNIPFWFTVCKLGYHLIFPTHKSSRNRLKKLYKQISFPNVLSVASQVSAGNSIPAFSHINTLQFHIKIQHSPLVLLNHSNTPAEAIQTWMSAGNPYPNSSCCRKVPLLFNELVFPIYRQYYIWEIHP